MATHTSQTASAVIDFQPRRFMRYEEVKQLTGYGKSTLRGLELAGKFPARRRLTPCSICWCSREVEAYVARVLDEAPRGVDGFEKAA